MRKAAAAATVTAQDKCWCGDQIKSTHTHTEEEEGVRSSSTEGGQAAVTNLNGTASCRHRYYID